MSVTIAAEIGIDMGHRVANHESKCKNIHGHRYRIKATATGPLVEDGAETGMVMDFSFLKRGMMECIDEMFDHALCLSHLDPVTSKLLGPQAFQSVQKVRTYGYVVADAFTGKLVLIDKTPTAENLAEVWFHFVDDYVREWTQGRVKLDSLEVWETPNFSVRYVP